DRQLDSVQRPELGDGGRRRPAHHARTEPAVDDETADEGDRGADGDDAEVLRRQQARDDEIAEEADDETGESRRRHVDDAGERATADLRPAHLARVGSALGCALDQRAPLSAEKLGKTWPRLSRWPPRRRCRNTRSRTTRSP